MTPGEVVTEFIQRVEAKDFAGAGELLAEDVHYDNVPLTPKFNGRAEVVAVLEGFLGASPEVAWSVHRQTETGRVVMNERTDRFEMGGNRLEIPVVGVWEVADDGRITLWRDYFDRSAIPG
jgi:limonene-1,2-epoxide hydrolase